MITYHNKKTNKPVAIMKEIEGKPNSVKCIWTDSKHNNENWSKGNTYQIIPIGEKYMDYVSKATTDDEELMIALADKFEDKEE